MQIGQGIIFEVKTYPNSGQTIKETFVGEVMGSYFKSSYGGSGETRFIVNCVDMTKPTVKMVKSHITADQVIQFLDRTETCEWLNKSKYPEL